MRLCILDCHQRGSAWAPYHGRWDASRRSTPIRSRPTSEVIRVPNALY